MNWIVAIPLYNKSSTIERCLKSVLSQSLTEFDLLIVNDGSTDNSIAIVEERFSDSRINIVTTTNKGVSNARNIAIDYAVDHEHKYIAFLDADDYWENNHLELLDQLFKQYEDIQVVASNYITHFNNYVKSNVFSKPIETTQILEDLFTYSFKSFPLSSSSFACNVEVFEKTGNYNTQLTHGEDTELFIRLGKLYKIGFNTSVTVHIDRTLSGSSSIAIKDRKYPEFIHLDDSNNLPLHAFIQTNLWRIAIEHKMYGQSDSFEEIKKKIDKNALTVKQLFLLNLPGKLLYYLHQFKTRKD